MNNFYHKVTVASVCTGLILTLGANQEAKAATFTLNSTSFGLIEDYGVVNRRFSSSASVVERLGSFNGPTGDPEIRAFHEFNIGNLSLASNTIISRAILNTSLNTVNGVYRGLYLVVFGYVGNGRPDVSDFDAGVGLDSQNAYTPYPFPIFPRSEINFDVTNFVNQLVSNGDDFAGFGLRIEDSYVNYGRVTQFGSSLTIETADVAEPVPEPTTIFGSAIVLGVGGWLKRKKSSQQNKTTSSP